MFWKNRIFRYTLRVNIIFRLAIKSDVFQMARVKFILQKHVISFANYNMEYCFFAQAFYIYNTKRTNKWNSINNKFRDI